MSDPMPAGFFGHGSQTNAPRAPRYTEAWRSSGAEMGRPRAVLVVSAHWYTNAPPLPPWLARA